MTNNSLALNNIVPDILPAPIFHQPVLSCTVVKWSFCYAAAPLQFIDWEVTLAHSFDSFGKTNKPLGISNIPIKCFKKSIEGLLCCVVLACKSDT